MKARVLTLLLLAHTAGAQLVDPPAVPAVEELNPLFDFGKLNGIPTVPPPALAPLDAAVPDMKPPQPAQQATTKKDEELLALAMHVAPSVVTLRVWDEFGRVLSSGVGCFVSKKGLLLTDAGLLHPEIAARIDYITTTSADGRNYRISGWHTVDLQSGVALLQSEEQEVAALPVRLEPDFSQRRSCRFLGVDEKRGLIFADAEVEQDSSLAGGAWLNVTGQDSPGAPGSPLLDKDGYIIGVVALRLGGKKWANYALPSSMAAYEIGRLRQEPRSLKQLPRSPVTADVVKSAAFLNAWEDLRAKKVSRATRALLQLTQRYPRSAECWALLGLCCSKLTAHAEATHCQRKAAALDPRTGLYWQQLAMAQMQKDAPDVEAEREALEEAVKLQPGDQLSWYMLATRLTAEQNFLRADEALQQVIKLEADYAPAFYLLAYVRGKLGDTAGALVAIQRCLELDDRDAKAWFYLALLQEKRRLYADAVASYKRAAELDAQLPYVWRNLARGYELMGDATAARRVARDAAAAMRGK